MRRRRWISLVIALLAFVGGAIANQLVGGLGPQPSWLLGIT